MKMATNYDKKKQAMAASMRKVGATATAKPASRPGAASAYAGNKMTPSGASAYAKARGQFASAKPSGSAQTSRVRAMPQLKRTNISTTSLKKKTY
jgi:hypothetical protein